MAKKQHYAGYDEYWVDFLRKHSKLETRVCHYLATGLALGPGLYGLLTLNLPLAGSSFAVTYLLAIFSHRFIEQDRPMAGKPGWGAYSDLRMCWLALRGKLQDERKRFGLLPVESKENEGSAKVLLL
jgi:hypothetical protein